MHKKYQSKRKKGALNAAQTKRWDGTKWVPVNVVHKGQRATLGGKPVVADGNGNWRSPGSRGNSLEGTRQGSVAGSYQSGDRNRKPAKTTKPPKSSNNAAAINARLKKQKEARAAALAQTRGNYSQSDGSTSSNRSSTPKPPKTPKSPKPPTTTKPPKATKPPKGAATTSNKTTPAKRKPRTWLAENYKPGKGPARRSTAGNASNKPKQSARMAEALKSLKVRKYKK